MIHRLSPLEDGQSQVRGRYKHQAGEDVADLYREFESFLGRGRFTVVEDHTIDPLAVEPSCTDRRPYNGEMLHLGPKFRPTTWPRSQRKFLDEHKLTGNLRIEIQPGISDYDGRRQACFELLSLRTKDHLLDGKAHPLAYAQGFFTEFTEQTGLDLKRFVILFRERRFGHMFDEPQDYYFGDIITIL